MLAQTPTMSETGVAGLHGFDAEAWWAICGPANMPVAVSALLRLEFERIVLSSAFRERLGNLGVTPAAAMRTSFADFHRLEVAKWGKAVQDSGATLE